MFRGQEFTIKFEMNELKFKVTHDYVDCVRVRIDGRRQVIFIPKKCLVIDETGKIIDAQIRWKLVTTEFFTNLNLLEKENRNDRNKNIESTHCG